MDIALSESTTYFKMDRLGEAFLKLAECRLIAEEMPEVEQYAEKYRISLDQNDADETEMAFLDLYCALHRVGDRYSNGERQRLDEKNGYFNHPGGISPLLKAERFIESESIVADLGAGNGLQGLMLRYLYPHKETRLIELSEEMIRIGRIYQEVLGFKNDNVKWIHDDIQNISLREIDFLYLYRPSKPIANGIQLYQAISNKLGDGDRKRTIFSIADCLKDYLDTSYSIFYSDGHLTCFERK